MEQKILKSHFISKMTLNKYSTPRHRLESLGRWAKAFCFLVEMLHAQRATAGRRFRFKRCLTLDAGSELTASLDAHSNKATNEQNYGNITGRIGQRNPLKERV